MTNLRVEVRLNGCCIFGIERRMRGLWRGWGSHMGGNILLIVIIVQLGYFVNQNEIIKFDMGCKIFLVFVCLFDTE